MSHFQRRRLESEINEQGATIKRLEKRIEFLEKENEKLRKENDILKI